eukprot:jgi/Bigna1/67235/fgenesh1_pg.3_\
MKRGSEACDDGTKPQENNKKLKASVQVLDGIIPRSSSSQNEWWNSDAKLEERSMEEVKVWLEAMKVQKRLEFEVKDVVSSGGVLAERSTEALQKLAGSSAGVEIFNEKEKLKTGRQTPTLSAVNGDEKGKNSGEEPSENVYFWGLPSHYTELEMTLLAFAAGDVVSVRMGPSNGKPHTHAFVQFTKLEEAERAIKFLNKRKFDSRHLVVRYAKPVTHRNGSTVTVNSALSAPPRSKIPTPAPATYGMRSQNSPMQYYPRQQGYHQNGSQGYYQNDLQMAYGSRYGASGGGSYTSDNIYISGLPDNVTDKYIERLFMMYGSIVSTKILQNPQTGAPLGTALVRMQNSHQAASAIHNLNGFQLMGGSVLSCRYANEKQRGPPSSTNLYLSGLPNDVTDSSLRMCFVCEMTVLFVAMLFSGDILDVRHIVSVAPALKYCRYGNIVSTKVLTSRDTGLPLGNALVRVQTSQQAAVARQNLDGCQLNGGQVLSCRFANEKSAGPTSATNLYVSGLPATMTESYLKELFAPYGSVTSQKIITNRATGMPLGTALVRMETNEQANACINSLNGAQMPGGKYLSIRFATEKGVASRRHPFHLAEGFTVQRLLLLIICHRITNVL